MFSVMCAEYAAKKTYSPTSSSITLNSRRYDMTSVERNVDQSSCLYTGDVAHRCIKPVAPEGFILGKSVGSVNIYN